MYPLKSHNNHEWKTVFNLMFVKSLMFSLLSTETVLWIFTKNLSQEYADAKGLDLSQWVLSYINPIITYL